MLGEPANPSGVVIGVFNYASDARRALNALHERGFTSKEVEAVFRRPEPATSIPAPSRDERATGLGRPTNRWFGELRQIYHGAERAPTPALPVTRPDSEMLLAQADLSEPEARALDDDLSRGGAILVVRSASRNADAEACLRERGARIVRSSRVASGPAATAGEPVTVSSAPFTAPLPAESDHIQLFGEVLRVHKEKVSAGDVHVRKESVTHMETVQVPVTREHLVIEHDGDRQGQENAIRVPLSEERVHIDKDTVLREEYKVGKREVTKREIVGDRVRRERLLIDDAATRDNE